MKKIAIIGGTGLEDPDIIKEAKELKVKTPYGETSSPIITGHINKTEVVIISRHGKKHTIPPTHVNNRAHIYAIKQLECTHIIATTACGSLRQEIGRGQFVVPDQFIDFTHHRAVTFFDSFKPGELQHAPMANPFDDGLRKTIIAEAEKIGVQVHKKGTVITIEGPRFSTRAESHMFRAWGADIINMSTAPEVILANEMQIPYAAIAMSTDYDCWKEDEAPVTWDEVMKIFKQNVNNVVKLLTGVIDNI